MIVFKSSFFKSINKIDYSIFRNSSLKGELKTDGQQRLHDNNQ